jgi:hypothetical protein
MANRRLERTGQIHLLRVTWIIRLAPVALSSPGRVARILLWELGYRDNQGVEVQGPSRRWRKLDVKIVAGIVSLPVDV